MMRPETGNGCRPHDRRMGLAARPSHHTDTSARKAAPQGNHHSTPPRTPRLGRVATSVGRSPDWRVVAAGGLPMVGDHSGMFTDRSAPTVAGAVPVRRQADGGFPFAFLPETDTGLLAAIFFIDKLSMRRIAIIWPTSAASLHSCPAARQDGCFKEAAEGHGTLTDHTDYALAAPQEVCALQGGKRLPSSAAKFALTISS